MNIFQMVCFTTLANTSTFHEAAEKLYLSQSAFSNNIQTIERELGIKLISRDTRRFTITQAGRAFMNYASRIVSEYERMTNLISEYKNSIEYRVCIYVEPFCSYGYNDLLTSFRQAEPDILTEIAEFSRDRIISVIESSYNAAGILFSEDMDPIPGIKSRVLLRDRLVALVSGGHPMAQFEKISMRDLESETLLLVARRHSTFFDAFVTQQCIKAGFSPNISPYSLWYSTIPTVLRDLNYTAVISHKAAKIICPPDIHVIEISDAKPFYIATAISQWCTHKATQRFYDFDVDMQALD